MEVGDNFVFMDEEGLVIKVEMSWSCRRTDWARTSTPKVLDPRQFERFKTEKKDSGDWVNWVCDVGAGPVIFSRDLQRAQRDMNASPLRPDCAPQVPETGRNNWEMLEYDRCLLTEQVAMAQREFTVEFALRLADVLGESQLEGLIRQDPGARLIELTAKAKAKKLGLYDNACDRVVPTAYDLIECRMADRKAALARVQKFLPLHHGRVEGQRGRDGIEQPIMDGIAADAASLRKDLRAALGESEER
ncbi:MAG: hypothetical protein FD126_1874 [Elusimicrobia bacterium]|nr:MAG: hypothetical protein FD126_1874 [Elusimicrobiota bacterium]